MSVLQVCSELFGFSMIDLTDNSRRISWFTDASIPYFQNGHIPMLLIAVILTLVYLLPFPFFLLFPSLVFKSKYLRYLKPFYDAYWHPFEPKFRFWLGFRLIFRWIPYILTFVAPSPINIFVTDCLLLVLLFVQVTVKPFKKWWVNTIDSFFIYLLIFMFTGTLYFAALDSGNEESLERGTTIYNQILTVLAFLLMCGLFYYHLYIRFPKVKDFSQMIWHKLRCKKGEYKPSNTEPSEPAPEAQKDSQSTTASTEPKAPTTQTIVVSTKLREPLLEDDNFATVISVPSDNPDSTIYCLVF